MTTKAQADIRRKLKVLNQVKETGNVSKAAIILASPVRLITNGNGIMNLKGKRLL